jgi:hypothetical protein
MKSFFSSSIRVAVGGILAVFLIALMGWGIRSLVPASPPPADVTQNLPTPLNTSLQATELPSIPTEASLEQPTQASPDTSDNLQSSAKSMPGIQFSLDADFSQPPEQITLYRIQLPNPVNADSARQTAAEWGMKDLNIYNLGPGETDKQVLLDATNGIELMRFVNFAEQFLYWPNFVGVLDDNGPILPFDQQVAIATQYLQAKGVLDSPYRVVPIPEERSKVRFVQLLDEIPIIYSIGTNRGSTEWIDVSTDSAGAVTQVDVAQHDYQPIGEFPILSAQQAWERFVNENKLQHAVYAVLSPEKPVTYQSWTRNPSYQPGQPVDLYGYVSVMQPVDATNPAWVSMNNLTINADPDSFTSANPWDFIHLWGEIAQKENSSLVVDMEGWEISPLRDDTLTGTIQRQGDSGLFLTQSGDFILPDLPDNYPDGALANVRGVTVQGNPPIFEWSNIDTGEIPFYYGSIMSCGGTGGGGGGNVENANFGGGNLSGLNLSAEPVEVSESANEPYSPAYPIDAIAGTPHINIYQYTNGQQLEEIFFYPDADSGLTNEFSYKLEGIVLGNILTPNLPVRIWGKVDRFDPEASSVVIDVTQFEPVYPDLHLQQWAGTEQIANVEGRDVVLFTTTDGQTYVTSPSLEWPADSQIIGVPGDQIGLEGYLIPDQLYGGYAIIKEIAGEVPPDNVIESAKPSIIELSMMEGYNQEQALVGNVMIENIELAYRSTSMQRCTSDFASYPDADQFLTLQPVWVFTGRFDDGRRFQLQVQALPDPYLY